MPNKLWIGLDGNYGTAGNWNPANAPIAADHVRLPAGAKAITAGLNQSAIAIGDFIVEAGFTDQAIGVAQTPSTLASYLQIDPDKFEFAGSGTKGAYIDLGAAAIQAQILDSPIAQAAGLFGLYLKGSALTVLNLVRGSVALAGLFTETSSVTTARVLGTNSRLFLGSGVTITTLEVFGGEVIVNCAVTNLIVWGGKVTSWGAGAITTADLYGGDSIFNSTGTITTLNSRGGNADFQQSGAARTVTFVNAYPGGQILVNKNAVTFTNGITAQENLAVGL